MVMPNETIAIVNSGDIAWVLAATVLALAAAMAGFAFGRPRRSLTPLLAACAAANLLWAAVGYGLAFGDGSALLGGFDNAFLADLSAARASTALPETVFAFLQLGFVLIALGLVLASLSERASLRWSAIFAPLWTLLALAPVMRWLFGGGWLAELGAIDAGGGLVLHATAGIGALVAGRVLGRAAPSGASGLVFVGLLTLLGASTLAAGDETAAALLNALLAASAGALLWTALTGARSESGLISGAIAGLAAVAAGAPYLGAPGAIALGLIGAMVAIPAQRLGTVVAVHAAAGLAGAVALPLFLLEAFGGPGLPEGATLAGQFAAQALAALVVAAWVALTTFAAATIAGMLVPSASAHPSSRLASKTA